MAVFCRRQACRPLIDKKTFMYRYLILFFALLALSVSCRKGREVSVPPLQYVTRALSDTSSAAYGIISGYDDRDNSGSVTVIGPLVETAIVCETLVLSDRFDNIDGRNLPDSLPDFAGEKICAIFDIADAPYAGYLKTMNETFLRETAARCAVEAVNGRCYSHPFDHRMGTEKGKAKMLVLSSSLMSGYGYDDICSMFGAAGKRMHVVAPLQSVFRHIFRTVPEADTVGVWADVDVIASGVYGSVSAAEAKKREAVDSEAGSDAGKFECVCLSPQFTGNPAEDVKAFLDMYSNSGNKGRLDAVILDDMRWHGHIGQMNAALTELLGADTPEAAEYRSLVSEECAFISPADAMSEECYRILRSEGRFTHRIALPEAEGYLMVPAYNPNVESLDRDGCFKEDYKYNRAPGSETETTRLIPADVRYLPPCAETPDSTASIIYKSLFHVYQ